MRLVSKNLWREKINLIHKISSIIGTYSIQINVIGIQEKNLKLRLLIEREVMSIKTCINPN